MSEIGILDRARIEQVVWSVDQRLYDLPRRVRIGRRRELRQNLLDAARHVGATSALRDIGSPAALAGSYLDAELGSAPRHSWLAAGLFLMTATFLLTTVLFEAAQAYGDGLLAADPTSSGTFHWPGISMLQADVTYTAAEGEVDFVGGAFTPVTWLLLAVGTVLVGRLWRAIPAFRPRSR